MKIWPISIITVLLLYSTAFGQKTEPQVDAKEMPRIPATALKDVLSTFKIADGYQLDLVAHEPNVVDPIAVSFDENGAMFVVEMRGYSERREESLGRIRKLTDTNDDGIYDTSTIYVDGLKWPTAVICYQGGIFVGATPNIHYFKDTNGDGVSDEKKHIFTGFGPDTTKMRLNMQALFNSFRWGPDNRIWGTTSKSGGIVSCPNKPDDKPLSLRHADFSFDPETFDLRAENGTGQYGMAFDKDGNRYVCSNSDHIVRVMWERHWTATNPHFSMPTPLVSVAPAGKVIPVFRLSPDEPWRIVRTRWRVAGTVKGIVEGNGRVSGFFTAATGINIYKGDAMPADTNRAFICDVGSNLVHRKKINNDTVQPIASRIDENSEFIASSDNWFRPVTTANAPDGSLYIIDMCRETIEHPWSLPEGIKKHVDLNSGWDRGRIYRAAANGFKHAQTPKLGTLNDDELLALTKTKGNSWKSDTARRLLYERGKPVLLDDSNSNYKNLLALAKNAPSPDKTTKLITLAKTTGDDPWMIAAAANAIQTADEAKAVFEIAGTNLRIQIAEQLGKIDGANSADWLASKKPSLHMWTAFSKNKKNGKAIVEHAADTLANAQKTVSNPAAEAAEKSTAFDLLINTRQLKSPVLEKILTDSKNSTAFRLTAFDAYQSANPDALAAGLTENWAQMNAEIKGRSLPFFVKKKTHALILLEAVKNGDIAIAEIPPTEAKTLRAHSNKDVKALAQDLIPAPIEISRQDVVKKYLAALKLKGDAAKGELAYQKACITCHKSPDGEGFAIGPDFATFKTAGGDSIINNLFDPNKEIAPQYQAYTFTLKNGEAYTATITSETQTDVTIRVLGGLEKTFPRSQVTGMKGLGISMMPEGLEASLTIQEVADLLAFIAEN